MTNRHAHCLAVVVVSLAALRAPIQAQQELTSDEIADLRARAEQGEAGAPFSLGIMYANGEDVSQDDAEAVRWYRLAANQGNAVAQYNLGIMYERGRGVPEDQLEAHMWFDLAAAQVSAEDRDRYVEARDDVAGRMTPERIVEPNALHGSGSRRQSPRRQPRLSARLSAIGTSSLDNKVREDGTGKVLDFWLAKAPGSEGTCRRTAGERPEAPQALLGKASGCLEGSTARTSGPSTRLMKTPRGRCSSLWGTGSPEMGRSGEVECRRIAEDWGVEEVGNSLLY